MLPIDNQCEAVFCFKTHVLADLHEVDKWERHIKQDILRKMRVGGKFDETDRISLAHRPTLHLSSQSILCPSRSSSAWCNICHRLPRKISAILA